MKSIDSHENCVQNCAIALTINILRPRENGRHFPDDILKCIFVNENVWISIKIPLTFVPNGPIDNIPALVQIMAWRRPGDKPLSEPMMVSLLTHICVTRRQWVSRRLCQTDVEAPVKRHRYMIIGAPIARIWYRILLMAPTMIFQNFTRLYRYMIHHWHKIFNWCVKFRYHF